MSGGAVQQLPSGLMAKGKTICAALSVPDQSLMGWWSVGELCWLVVKGSPMFPLGVGWGSAR